MRRILLVLAAAALMAMMMAAMAAPAFARPADNPKVTMCHHPDDTTNFRGISVSVNAVQPHLQHGDFLGASKEECENLLPG